MSRAPSRQAFQEPRLVALGEEMARDYPRSWREAVGAQWGRCAPHLEGFYADLFQRVVGESPWVADW